MGQPASGLHRTGRAARSSIVLLCAELQDSMIGNKGTCPPPESWARRKHALLQVRRTALLYLFTIAGPCRWLAPRPGLPWPGPITACIHAHFYLGHSLLPRLSGLVLTMYDRIPLNVMDLRAINF